MKTYAKILNASNQSYLNIIQLEIIQLINDDAAKNGLEQLTDTQKASAKLAKEQILKSLNVLDEIETKIEQSMKERKSIGSKEQLIIHQNMDLDRKELISKAESDKEWTRDKEILIDFAFFGAFFSLVVYLDISGSTNILGAGALAGVGIALLVKKTLDLSKKTGDYEDLVDLTNEVKSIRLKKIFNDLNNINININNNQQKFTTVNTDELSRDQASLLRSIKVFENLKNSLNQIERI